MHLNSIKHLRRRQLISASIRGMVLFFTALTLLPLVYILIYIIKQGIGSINWSFFTQLPRPVGETGGGIANALVGSLIIVGLATLLAIPIGIFSALYLSEHPQGRLAGMIRFCVEVLTGIPSIVVGIVAYDWLVRPMGSFSAFSGSVALSIMMLPIMIRSAEETLKRFPTHLREASLALGVPYYKTILQVLLPCSLSGVLSGIILSVARIVGETAPLLFTAFGNPYLSFHIFHPMHSLPLLIYNYAISPYDSWHQLAWGAALVLLCWILLLNILTRMIIRKWSVRY
ncbi:phosphate ABC transporter membrane protein 2 (PhoT family) [Thermoflavifilum aggregans]|uniref:Phosphate transport system permease protein PstA n=1 Tax=Thermoflavifilum aggregans TaxID=454188 RepID=A0A2M9CXR0_9BACT|nr:phosphate ABC transporter permease PstA [Thermoflavifilum aggregans]PJJ76701.1 phosphate ABC transporter membrane protein 2 (PhoT family) [Thermoflavifilum aggregans]